MQLLSIFRFIPLFLLRVIAKNIAGLIQKKTDRGMFKKTSVNLSLAYPHLSEEERNLLAKHSIQRQCLSYAESLKCWAMPPEWSIKQIREVHHLEVLLNALSNPKGALIITPHLGTWEMMNAWVHQYGIPTIMYKPIKNTSLNHSILSARKRLKANLVPTDATGVKALFKNLKQGGFSVVLPDHVPQPSGGVIAPFFTIPCLTSTLASKMAQKTSCKLVGLSCFRREDGNGFDVYCDDLNDPLLYNADLEVAVTALNHAVENMINRSPSDYMWGYKRFRGTTALEKCYQ